MNLFEKWLWFLLALVLMSMLVLAVAMYYDQATR